jgi:hypothetical protein
MESGVQDFSKSRGESNGMLFLKFNRWLEADLALNQRPTHPARCMDLLVFEQAHHRGGAATEIAVGLMTRVLEYGALYKIEHTSVHSMTLKKWATGSGKSDKAVMRAAACKFTKPERSVALMGDDESDAILLLQYALEKFGGTNPCNVQPVAARKIESLGPSTPAD